MFTQPTSEELDALTAQTVGERLESSAAGLTSAQAQERLTAFGHNALEEKQESALLKFFKFFWGPIPWMIEIAAILSAVAGDWRDFIIITALLIFNGVLGFWEEHKASNALDALKAGLALKARVLRDGQWSEIDAADLVPGDVVRLRLGDVIPADCVLLEGDYISIDQAALTGESLPVNKKVGDTAYSGSIAKQGEMIAMVADTGEHTFFGRTAKLVANAGNTSHFQKAVLKVGNFLIVIAIFLCLLLLSVLIYRLIVDGQGLTLTNVVSLTKFILILAVASIPVAMPAVLEITMALGAVNLSKHKAIVSRLEAIEEMAGVDVLCSDKTGTLTQNKLTLGTPLTPDGVNPEQVLLAGALASRVENNDAIDTAVVNAVSDPAALKQYQRTAFIPFDPISKRTEATLVGPDGEGFKTTKGAPQVIMELCGISTDSPIQSSVNDLAAHGYRTLGVARTNDVGADAQDASWQYLGVIPMSDPPREDSKETIEAAKAYGLDVKMVTGDDTAIGSEISGQLGMGTNIVPASDVFAGVDPDDISDELGRQIEKADGFARVFPEHKYGIVKALQERGHIVAMTGDGVNDAPALKQADAGVAVSGATDAARAAASLILTAPGLSVIIRAIETARQIFERMMSYTIYRIAMTMDVMLFVVMAIIFFPHVEGVTGTFMPLTAIMIILLALLDDIPIMTIAYDNSEISPVPVRWDMRRILTVSTVLGLLSVAETFGLFAYALDHVDDQILGVTLDPSHIQTMMFLQLVVGGHLMLFVTRQQKWFCSKPGPSWQLFSALMGTQIFAAVLCGVGWESMGIPQLPWALIGLVWVYNLVWMVGLDLVKHVTYRVLNGDYDLPFQRMRKPLSEYGSVYRP